MVKRAAEHGVVDSYHRFYLKRIDLAFEIVLCADPLPTSANNPRKFYPEYHYSRNYYPSKNLRYTISVYSPGIHICPMPHRMSMGVPFCPSKGSLMLYTVLVSHPVQLSSRHMVGHSMGSCVSIGQLDGMGHQDWVLSLCCWTSYEA